MRDHPDVFFLIDHHPVVVIGVQGFLHVIVLPADDAFLAPDAHQFTVRRHENHTILCLRIGRHTELLGELVLTIAEVQVLQILRHGVEIVESIFVGFDPIVLLRIQMEALNGALDTLLVEPA